eukprot:6100787-Alexandrium_andersonii.AAC.1
MDVFERSPLGPSETCLASPVPTTSASAFVCTSPCTSTLLCSTCTRTSRLAHFVPDFGVQLFALTPL